MKALVVRVNKAKVCLGDKAVSSIGKGIALFVGIANGDNALTLNEMAEKVANLRIFENETGKLNYSVREKSYQILCVPNFTLCANTAKGRRPSFEEALSKEEANKLFEDFILLLKARQLDVNSGVFGEYMDIELDLDGPVNIILEINNTK
jgi:D-tyrosyl-tRNA(Tyr) deacylase